MLDTANIEPSNIATSNSNYIISTNKQYLQLYLLL